MTKIMIHEILRGIRQSLINAGFVQKPAREIRIDDRIYNGTQADIAKAVPVMDIKQWRNGSVYIVRRHYAGDVGLTHNADELLWVVPRD